METTILYWGYIGIMEKKMETTTVKWEPNFKQSKCSLLASSRECNNGV